METVLVVGELPPAAATTLEDRGFSIDVVDSERLLDEASDVPETATESAVEESLPTEEAACAIVDAGATVDAGADDVTAIEALRATAEDLPVLYSVSSADASAAGSALAAGADDRVLLTGEADGERIARRIERLDDAVATNGAGSSTPDFPDPGDVAGVADDRIGALLECVQAFMNADTATDVAESVVETAERALGYEVVAVLLVGDDGETLEPVAQSERTDELVGALPVGSLEESVLRPAIDDGQPVELDGETLATTGVDPLGSGLALPIGDHGVIGFGSTREDAFGHGDRRVGELLAANARGALDRIERDERIEAVHSSMRELLGASNPEAVAGEAVRAAREILDYPFVACFLEGADGQADDEGLEPVAWTDEIEALSGGELPVPTEGDGAFEAYRSGTVVRRDGTAGAAAGDLGVASRFHVPIDGHGSLLLATPGAGGVDETDVQLARLLATNTSRALDRVSRTQELERLETVFETVNDMVYVHDTDGRILHCTPVLAEQLGYDRDALIGRNVGSFVGDESQAEAVNLIQELLGESLGATRTHRVDLETADGETVPVEIDLSLLPGEEYRGVVGAVRDISDLLDVRERLDSQQDRFEYLFENIPDPVVEGHFEEGQAIVEATNGAFEETFGYEEAEVAGEPLNEVIVPEENRAHARALDRQTAAGSITQVELERETQYGLREFLFRGVPYENAEGVTRAFGIYTDITEQKERERHLEVLQRLLRHNVRNEVNVLLAGIDQLEEIRDGGEGREAELLETLEETAQDLLSMGQKAKRISKVIDAEAEELGEVDAAAVVRSVAERYRQLEPDATLTVDAPEQCRVIGTSAIERALEELVGNALEHGGRSPTTTVTLERAGEDVELTVTDDGPGIPEAEREVLEDGEITPLKHGSGLGLWLVTHAVAASGGTVSFDDDAAGASVTLTFRQATKEA